MAKVQPQDGDVIFEGEWLQIRAMQRRSGARPAKDWFDGLESKGKGQVLAAARVLETTLRSGRPPSGRAEQITTVEGLSLWELKVTKPGSSPPHLRLLYVRVRQTLWAAVGFTKQKNKLTSQEISAGETVTLEWREGSSE